MVDDNVDAVEAIAMLLKLDGHVTELALNGLVVLMQCVVSCLTWS